MERRRNGQYHNHGRNQGNRGERFRLAPGAKAYTLPSAAKTPEEKAIVAALERCSGEDGVPSKSLFKETGLTDKMAFYDALHRLEEAGELKVDNQHWVKLLSRDGDVEATLVSLSEKFGFARPKNGTEDIFVPGSALNGAFLGDQVILTGLQIRDKGPSGRVKRVVARAQNTMTGTVHQRENGFFLTPDGALRFDLEVQKSDLHGAKDGDKVLFEARQNGRGDSASSTAASQST